MFPDLKKMQFLIVRLKLTSIQIVIMWQQVSPINLNNMHGFFKRQRHIVDFETFVLLWIGLGYTSNNARWCKEVTKRRLRCTSTPFILHVNRFPCHTFKWEKPVFWNFPHAISGVCPVHDSAKYVICINRVRLYEQPINKYWTKQPSKSFMESAAHQK